MSLLLPVLVLFVFGYGMIRKVSVFSCFCDGVRDGLRVCLGIFPVLLLILAAVSVFRASGGMDLLISLLSPLCRRLSIPPQILPLALVRPLSGGGALSVCEDLLRTFGADSALGRMAAVLSASTETTFYTLGIYLPSLSGKGGVKLIFCALLCDLVTLILTVITVSVI